MIQSVEGKSQWEVCRALCRAEVLRNPSREVLVERHCEEFVRDTRLYVFDSVV